MQNEELENTEITNQKIDSQEIDNQELEGLNGWLLLIGFGLIVGPISMAISAWPLYSDLVNQGILTVLINPGSEFFDPMLGLFIFMEMVINLAVLFAFIYLIYLFFSKSHLFPKYFIFIVLFNIAFIFLDSVVGYLLIPDEPMFDQETIRSLVRQIIGAIIWISYMLKSKRVAVTFTRHRPVNKEKNTIPEAAS